MDRFKRHPFPVVATLKRMVAISFAVDDVPYRWHSGR